MRSLSFALAALVLSYGASCAHPHKPALPEAVLDALRLPSSLSAKVYLGPCGGVRKSTAYLPREAMPEWVLAMADEKLGAGEDIDFEVEVYRDGMTVYEVTRRVDGVEVELAVNADKTVRYSEKYLDPTALPEVILGAVAAVDGFVAEKAAHKQGPTTEEYKVTGMRDGRRYQLVFDAAGLLRGKSRILAAELVLDE